jgi:hypothetical protein
MGRVYEDFQQTLDELRGRLADDPRREMVQLFLMALEREEIVAVGYRESLMAGRLDAMPLPADAREVIGHALIWIWKDEEIHSIYIRGAILRLGNPLLEAQALATQLAGGVGGWAASALQHTRWRSAPLSRLLAKLVTWAGMLVGKVPADVRQHLRYGPFRDFCRFNIDAEKTAWLCWDRLAELARADTQLEPRVAADFARIARDEQRHGQIFEILADALDERDELVPGETAATLAEKIGRIDPVFLPRSWRRVDRIENPLGSGGRVWCLRGGGPDEKRPLFQRLLEESQLGERLRERAGYLGKRVDEMRVAVKPTFMLGYHKKDRSPLTDPELLHDLGETLHNYGCSDVALVEGRNIYDHFYRNRAVRDVAGYFGIDSPHYRLADAAEEQVPHDYARGMAQYTVSRTWRDADFRISFGKLRSHPIELALLCVGNVEWVGARCDEFLFLERQADRATAVMMLLAEFPPHFALLDGYDQAPDGLVGVMGAPKPKSPRRLYAAADALALDTVAAGHVGVRHPRESSLLESACHWFGGWSEDVEVIGCDEPVKDWRGPYASEWWALLSLLAYPVYVMGSGRGRLFVPEFDEAAFPPIKPEGWWLRLRRRAVRRLLGLRHPRGK